MKEVFEAIAYFFEEIILLPFHWLGEVEADNWWLANTFSWVAILVLVAALGYWMSKLKEYDKDEDKTQTGHSFLG